MKRIVKSDSEGLTIKVSEISGQQEQLLAGFTACQEGRCSCPTNEYQKLDSLNIEAVSGNIRLTLKAKSGQFLHGTQRGQVNINRQMVHCCTPFSPSRPPSD